MIKRCIGIDIGSSCLRAVQVSRAGEQFRIEKAFSIQTRRGSDSPPDILRSLTTKYGFDRRADVAISMPHSAVFFRNFETDSTGLEKIREHTSSALEDNFPIQSDETVAQICSEHRLSGERYSLLAAAVTRASLRERLNALIAAKIRPDLVDAAIFAVHATVVVNNPEVMSGSAFIAYTDDRYLTFAVTQDNNILVVRSIPIVSCSDNDTDLAHEQVAGLLVREAQLTWRKLFGGEIEQGTKIYLLTGCDVSDDLGATIEENLHCQTITVDPHTNVDLAPECGGDGEVCVAEGLALRVLAPERTTGANFLEADNVEMKPALDLKREFLTCAALVAAVVVVSVLGLFIRLSRLETKYARVRNEITKVFKGTLPEETNIVSPLVQLEQKLQSLRADHTLFGYISGIGLEPLEVLHALTTSVPSEANITIDDMLITTESVRLTGTSQSFESVYNWKEQLQKTPQFSVVDVRDIGKGKSGLVNFTFSLLLATPEQR